MNSSKVPTLQEIKKRRHPIFNTNVEYRRRLRWIDRLALWVTDRVGTVGFFALILLWSGFWFFWNTFGPLGLRFDPFPAFVLWVFLSNTVQLLLLPLILIGQNLQGRHNETRAEADYEVNVKAELEVEVVLEHLEEQRMMLKKISDSIDKIR